MMEIFDYNAEHRHYFAAIDDTMMHRQGNRGLASPSSILTLAKSSMKWLPRYEPRSISTSLSVYINIFMFHIDSFY